MNSLGDLVSRLVLKVRVSSATPLLKKIIPRKIREVAWSVLSRQDEFKVMGSRMYIPPDSRSRDIVLDQYEPGVSSCLENLLKPGMVFCDVGANFGIFTLFASKIVGSNGKVFAFEPVEANRKVLDRNIERNHVENVLVFDKAVSDYVGVTRIFLSKDAGCHSISSEPSGFEGRFLDVDVVRLDEIREIPKIDVLKIDVEGAEIEVLKGLGGLQVDHVILEYNAEMILKRGMAGPEFIERIRGFGFKKIVNLDNASAGLERIFAGDETTVNLLLSRRSNC